MVISKEIPASAVPIKVTNVSNPSFIQIYHEDTFDEKHKTISEKLRVLMKSRRWKRKADKIKPQTGDIAIIQNRFELELPAWGVRGLLGNFNEKTLKFDVFLVDHGNIVEASIEDLTVMPKNAMLDDYLTIIVGLYNIVPTEFLKNSANMIKASKKWSDAAIRITRECITASSKLYFDYRAIGENGEKYGDLYLILDQRIVSLGDILVCNELAIYLPKDLFRLMKEENFDTMKKLNEIDDGIVIDFAAADLEAPEKKTGTIVNNVRMRDKKREKSCISKLATKGKTLIRYAGEECQEILIRSSIACERLMAIVDARFPERIHEVLEKLSITELRRIQSYMWPAVSKGLSVLAVGPTNCGKTIGYISPIVSCIASWKTMPKGTNPSILILCSSTSDVLSVHSLCTELLECYTDIHTVAGYNGCPDRTFVAYIYNGCQILIATPAYLVRFMNQGEDYRKILNFENLTHLVLDGIDVILDKYYNQFKKLLEKKHVNIGKEEHQNLDKQPLQIVAVGRKWTPLVSEFAKQCMTDPYVCIGSYLEATVFGRVKPELRFVKSETKMEKLTEILGDNVSMIKTMIVCSHSEEAQALNRYILKSKKTMVACENMTLNEISDVAEAWKLGKSGLYPVLICTDQVLVDLNLTDIDWLINYSVTLPSKTQFYFRFSTLMNNLKKGEGNCKMTIILDETNDVQLYGVVDVVKRCGTKLSSRFMTNVERIAATLDSRKKMYPICDNVKALGFCPKKNSCPYRHCVLNGVDTPTTAISIDDSVKLVVTFVHNATHFTGRVMEFITPDKEVTKYSAVEHARNSAMMQTYYAEKKNKRYRRKNVQVGDIFAVEESLDNFQRVKVLNIVEKDYDEMPIAVELKCIDTGAILPRISATQLMELPEELRKRNTHIVEVFLAGLSPYDNENEWNYRAIHDAHKWFSDATKPHAYVLGKVRLHLADTLWVDPLEIRTAIIGHKDLISASLKSHMIRLKHGVPNENHLRQLYELCEIAMIKDADGEDIVPVELRRSLKN